MADDAMAEAGVDFSGITDWQEAAALAAAAGSPLEGMPSGLRIRGSGRSTGNGDTAADGEDEQKPSKAYMPSARDIVPISFFVVGCLLMLWLQRATRAASAESRTACKQCQKDWWDSFWDWRLADSASGSPAKAPDGMEWEWDANGSHSNHTDWFGVSAELMDKVVSTYVDPARGPVLHIGCGDSPLPELLHTAGYKSAEHIDIAPKVVMTMQGRYPSEHWPGMSFAVRDFLGTEAEGGGPPPPLNRFAAVIDKAGIWDWLQDEAPENIPVLLSRVRDALILEPQRGVYILVTKQSPAELSDTLAQARANFLVETTQPLGTKGMAWSYVLEPL